MKQIVLHEKDTANRFFEYVGHCIEGKFITTQRTTESLEKVFKAFDEKKHGVCLLGNSGAGKTFIFECLRRIVHVQDERHFLIKSCIGIVEEHNIDGDRIFRDKWVRKNILWDDLMREPIGNYKHDVMPKILFNADERFKQMGVKTHITCNFMPEDIHKRYGDYIMSRINSMSQVIGLEPNQDFRPLKNFKSFPQVYHTPMLCKDDEDFKRKYEAYKIKCQNEKPQPHRGQGDIMRDKVNKFLGR